MNLSNFEDEELLDRVMQWACENPKFDSTFIGSLQDSYDEWGELTSNQREALENIALKWRVF